MQKIIISLSAAILLSLTNLASAQEAIPEACSGGHAGHVMDGGMSSTMDMSGLNEMQKAYMEGMNKMNAMMMPGMMAEDPDVAFVCSMIAHHLGAIDMARVQLQYGKDAWTRDLAQQIIDAQTKEIADMKNWLGEHGK
jgi:uncharacterized protein (DUF305 family)